MPARGWRRSAADAPGFAWRRLLLDFELLRARALLEELDGFPEERELALFELEDPPLDFDELLLPRETAWSRAMATG